MRYYEILLEYRIYNQSKLNDFLNQYIEQIPYQEGKEFFNKRIRKMISKDSSYLKKPELDNQATEYDVSDYQKGTLYDFEPTGELKDKLSHITDWLKDSELPETELDKLKGIQSIEQAYKKADQYFKWKNKKASSEELWEGLDTVMSFKDGFKIVQLTQEQNLKREGKLMGHCVGNYADEVEKGTIILSLRDPQNQPHATLEIDDSLIKQIKGKQNKPVVRKYQSYIRKFLEEKEFEFGKESNEELLNVGLISANSKLYDIYNLPEDITLGTSLDLSESDIEYLPKNLKVKGDLNLSETALKSLPEGLHVSGDLLIDNTSIESLPEDLRVDLSFHASFTPLKRLPKNAKLGKSIVLEHTPLKELPDDLSTRLLNISSTNISEIPNNLHIRDLIARDTPLAREYKGKKKELKRKVQEKGGYIRGRINFTL